MYKKLLEMIGRIKDDRLRHDYGDTLAKIAAMPSKGDRDMCLRGLKSDLKGDLSTGK